MDCPACKPNANPGTLHTCAGSGTWKAAEAYAADAVDEIEQGWDRFTVHVGFQIRSLDEKMVKDKLTSLVSTLLSDDQVEHAEFTITLLEKVA